MSSNAAWQLQFTELAATGTGCIAVCGASLTQGWNTSQSSRLFKSSIKLLADGYSATNPKSVFGWFQLVCRVVDSIHLNILWLICWDSRINCISNRKRSNREPRQLCACFLSSKYSLYWHYTGALPKLQELLKELQALQLSSSNWFHCMYQSAIRNSFTKLKQ